MMLTKVMVSKKLDPISLELDTQYDQDTAANRISVELERAIFDNLGHFLHY